MDKIVTVVPDVGRVALVSVMENHAAVGDIVDVDACVAAAAVVVVVVVDNDDDDTHAAYYEEQIVVRLGCGAGVVEIDR